MNHRLALLDPLGLAELDRLAARQTRVDRKYLVPPGGVAALLDAVAGEARVLDIDGVREFGYRSVYLDAPGLPCYTAAGRRRRRRAKVRTRCYLDTGATWLEVKTRGARGASVKQRTRLHAPGDDTTGSREREVLTGEPAHFVGSRFQDARVPGIPVAELRPTLVTTYRRSTLVVGADRATIDTELSWELPDGAAKRQLGDLAVVETKSAGPPTPVDRILWRLGHRPTQLSKYGTGLAALRPDLPRLKWHRVLARHLDLSSKDSSCAFAR